MIVYDKEQKQIVIPNGLGNVNIIINGGGECPECPELTEISITENGRYEGAYNVVNVDVPTEGGSCNLGTLDWTLTSPSTGVKNASDDGYNGYSQVIIRPENVIAQEKESAINDFKNKMKEITITENGTYSIEDQFYVDALKYNGGYHTDTISTYDINRIEVTFKADTSAPINGEGKCFILGGSLWGVSENSEDNAAARAIQYSNGRIVGYWEGKNTGAVGTIDGEWLTIVLDENGMTVKYPTYEEHSDYIYDNGQVNGGENTFPFIIGGQGRRKGLEDGSYTSNLIADSQFRGLIKNIKINTNSMGEITYIPKNLGYGVWDRKVENTGEFLSALEPTEGEVYMDGQWENKYPYGFKRIEVNVQQEGGGDCPECPDGGCTLTSRTFTSNGIYHPEAEQMPTIWFMNDKPSAYDTGIKLVDDSWVEIYFSATEGGDTPTLIGCEEGDWNETTFATRWYDNNLGVKIGRNEIGIPYTANDGALHKLKFGKTVGVWFDDVKVQDIAGEEWVPTDRTIYIGAMNDPSNNNENGFWRYWVGFIGDVTVYGKLNENVGEYHFKAGDYGRWGEFKRVEDDTNLPNLGGDGMAIAQIGSYGEAPDGYNEITVNVPISSFEGTNHNDDIFHREAYWDSVEGYSSINIDNRPYGENKKNEGKQVIQNNLKELNVNATGVGTVVYEAKMEDVAVPCLQIDGQRFLTDYQPRIDNGYVSQYGFEIIVKAKLSSSENGGILIGTAVQNDFEGDTRSTVILRTNRDATRLYLGKGWTPNEPTRLNEWVTYRITIDGLYISSESNPVEQHISWEVEPNIDQNSWSSKVAIGGLNTYYDGTSSDLRYSGRIAKVEFKQAETYSYVPAESGLFLRTETSTELQTIDGEAATYTTDTEKVGEYGWKKVTIKKEYATANDVLGMWYENSGIKTGNDQINSDWDQALRGETIQSVFPGIAFTISGQAVAKPFFINRRNGDTTATRIGRLVSSAYGTPVSCSVFSIGAFDCKNIQNVDLEAFKYMTDLRFIDGMNGLGESFISPQTINFTYCTNLFTILKSEIFMHNFAESLFDLSAGNKNGINTSTLKFKNAVQERSENADAIALMRSKGWTVEFVSSDL